jgi:hypothetical protein
MTKWNTILLIICSIYSINGHAKKNNGFSRDYVITIETWSFGGHRVKAVLYGFIVSQAVGDTDFYPNHLYFTREEKINDTIVSENYDLKLNDVVTDSIFDCVYNYLKKFPIKEKLKKKSLGFDGPCLSVGLEYGYQSITCKEFELVSLSSASPTIDALLKIINRRVPRRFQFY